LAVRDGNPLLRSYLGGIGTPELILYQIAPERVRYTREWTLEYHDVPQVPSLDR
jgi:hypothetical protein